MSGSPLVTPPRRHAVGPGARDRAGVRGPAGARAQGRDRVGARGQGRDRVGVRGQGAGPESAKASASADSFGGDIHALTS